MHRCQVKMRYDPHTPVENLIACGDHASKKIGQLWMCDFHYGTFCHVEDYDRGTLKSASDFTNSKE